MSRRDNVARRCPRCRLFLEVCVCALIPSLQTRTRLLLLIHRDEERKPTNTGRLGTLSLCNSELVLHGERDQPTVISWPEGSQPLLVFPHDEARPITEYARLDRPVTLIVPDGTWRQAAKMRTRLPALAGVPTVSLPEGAETRYRLRAERREGGLATIEAIARAFGVLEGEAVEQALLELFQIMVERTLWVRGQLAAAEVRGGIPGKSDEGEGPT